MTTYRAIAPTEDAVEAFITAELADAWTNNVLAIAEADANAPVNQTHWHPYNKVTNGDANTGLIYDFGVSGAVANVDSPDFADGYEYRFLLDRVGGGTTTTLNIALYRETDAAYGSAIGVGVTSSGNTDLSGHVTVNRPRIARVGHAVEWAVGRTGVNGSDTTNVAGAALCVRAAQKRLRARFSWSTGNIGGGKIYMERRRYIG